MLFEKNITVYSQNRMKFSVGKLSRFLILKQMVYVITIVLETAFY
jgi:hypothetical protein